MTDLREDGENSIDGEYEEQKQGMTTSNGIEKCQVKGEKDGSAHGGEEEESG